MTSRLVFSKIPVRGFAGGTGHLGDLGSGAGKSGGGGGSIRDAGGAFGKLQGTCATKSFILVAREEEYFHKLQHEQIKALKEQIQREIRFYEQQQKHELQVCDVPCDFAGYRTPQAAHC